MRIGSAFPNYSANNLNNKNQSNSKRNPSFGTVYGAANIYSLEYLSSEERINTIKMLDEFDKQNPDKDLHISRFFRKNEGRTDDTLCLNLRPKGRKMNRFFSNDCAEYKIPVTQGLANMRLFQKDYVNKYLPLFLKEMTALYDKTMSNIKAETELMPNTPKKTIVKNWFTNLETKTRLRSDEYTRYIGEYYYSVKDDGSIDRPDLSPVLPLDYDNL